MDKSLIFIWTQGLEYQPLTDIYLLNPEVPEFQPCPPLRNVQHLQSRLCAPGSLSPHNSVGQNQTLSELNKPADGQSGFLSTFISPFITQSLFTGIMESNGYDWILTRVTDFHISDSSWCFRHYIAALQATLLESREWTFLTLFKV